MPRERLSNAIVLDYLRKIGGGEMQPGEPLPPESAFCEAYGVGRSVVREALQSLGAKGFITVRQGAVTVVAPRYRWHVLDEDFLTVNSGAQFYDMLQEAREALEPNLAAIAAARATPELIAELTALNEALGMAGETPEKHAELDIAFHELLASASQNPILISWHSSITGLGHRTRSASAGVAGAVGRAFTWHGEIIAALRRWDAPAASAAMLLHLRQVRDELRHLPDQLPGSGSMAEEEGQ